MRLISRVGLLIKLVTVLAVLFTDFIGYAQTYNDPVDAFDDINDNNKQDINALAKQIQIAKQTENLPLLRKLEKQMNQLNGSQEIPFINDPDKTGMLTTEEYYSSESDGISTITNGGFWAVATQTSGRSSLIFAAVTEYYEPAGDRMKLYVSYDHGVTWILKCTFSGFVNGVRYRPEELDIEPLISLSDTLVYVTAGYTFNNRPLAQILRCDIRTGSTFSQSYNFTTTGSVGLNPRIVSDNTNYQSTSYMYITVLHDSTIAAPQHLIKTRLCIIVNPLETSFSQTHRNPGTNSSFWWSLFTGEPNTYFHHDIGYFRNTADNTDVIYAANTFPGLNNIYSAWSKTYGVSNSGNLTINDGFRVSNVRLAFNGGTTQDGAIAYLRHTSGNVDAMILNTNSGGFTLASFISTYLESTPDSATSCDIQAVKLAPNKFKFAYSLERGRCYYLSNISRTLYTLPVLVNSQPAGDGFGRVRAGYRVTSDSCLSVWSQNTGLNFYSTYGCDGFVGISQNETEIPQKYSLLQNYPNPFNPVTNIKFTLPKSSFVNLVVYDITGKIAAELVKQNMNAGSYGAEFDASHLSTGVYFYRITADEFTDVKKMVLVK